jgi:signal-transduction protein with cAMP-binding, CBS, and nucleotidyltransferase domain
VERLVRDVMHRGVVTCETWNTVKEVARMIVDFDVHAVVVLDEMGEACGIITKTDVMRKYGQDTDKITAEAAMTPHIISIKGDATVAEAAAMMFNKRIHQLVVIKGEPAGRRPVGIISVTDIIREIANRPRTAERRPLDARRDTARKVDG